MNHRRCSQHSVLRVRRLGIDTHRKPVIYMRRDCHVCRSEGFEAQARILVQAARRSIFATLNVLDGEWLAHGEAELSEVGLELLGVDAGDEVKLSFVPSASRHRVPGRARGLRRSYEELRQAGAARIVTCDAIAHPSNGIDLASLIAAGVRTLLQPTAKLRGAST